MIYLKDGTSDGTPPMAFGDSDFVRSNRSFYDAYIDMRARGYDSDTSFKRTFGRQIAVADSMDWDNAVNIVESTMDEEIQERKKHIPISELWNPKQAAHTLAEVANNKHASPRVRLGAARELNRILAAASREESANGGK